MLASGSGPYLLVVTTGKCPVAEQYSMVEITLVELNVEDGSFAANLPFSSGRTDTDAEEELDEAGAADEESSGGNKGLVLLGVLVFLVLATAAVKYLTGDDDEPDVVVETDDDTVTTVAE